MARRKAAPKRIILKDPVLGSEVVTKFMNVVMQRGKKACAEKIVYGALEKVAERNLSKAGGEVKDAKKPVKKSNFKTDTKLKELALDLFSKALDNLRPTVEVRSRRVGGATYQIPVEVRQERGIALAMRWLVVYSASRGEKTMALRLAAELGDVLEGRGSAMKKREDVHKMAKANQAFAHYRW